MSSLKTYFTTNHDIANFISTNHLNGRSLNKISNQFCQEPQNQVGFKTGEKKNEKRFLNKFANIQLLKCPVLY